MKKISRRDAKATFLRGWLRFILSVERKKNKKPKKGRDGNLRFTDDTTPIQNQVVSFIENISVITEYDSSILRRDAEKILIPKHFDLYDNPEKSLLFISAAAKLIARGKRKSYTFNYKKNKTHCLGLECLLGVALTAARQNNIYFKDSTIQINGVYPKDEQYLEIIRDIGLVKEISNADPGKVLDATEASKKVNPKQRIFSADSIGKENASAFAHDTKNITAEKFTKYINRCLNDHELKLVSDAEKHLTSCMGELLDNAERHCGLEQRSRWYLRGFVNNNVKNPICEIAVFNFGQTIDETFNNLPDNHFSLSKQVTPYVNKHIKKRGMFKEGLITVAALQGRVSCKNEKETDSSGTGTIELLKLFQDMYDNLKKMGRDIKGGVKMTLISGCTHINFDGSYQLKQKLVNDAESDIFTYPFNNIGLESEPDRTYLKRMKDARFPGVMINIRFPLPANATQRT
ncbi:hypothetical protein [Citrobacter sedlakii]|uniref:hypothetical protein n=1 Tax=Citrobacter sedlakii TaxID=67826 RepID=UPI001BA87CE0|nr:hypothetical protein [Citrobacter sedlakii]EKJ8218498.1 hypothetical protein [Citrobacter sedlakii]ELB4228966.1 hypothetical protein [Citrobacter amalonaticus]MCK8144514.1 hypothetical protein [Citrobacter sedlakii]QUC31267.1 hypothetical protein JY391_05880 [Citrobacter sedlakii]